ADQSDAQAGGRSIRELERLRDDCLISVMQGLRSHGVGAGAVLADWERTLMTPAAPQEVDLSRPLRLHAVHVPPEWIDYNGHMHESRYLLVFGDATDALLRHLEIDLAAGNYFTVETHLAFLQEAHPGDELYVTAQLLGFDEKRVHVFYSLYGTDDAPLATAEQ